jgi:N-acyl-L-homoserine lactone synthetase
MSTCPASEAMLDENLVAMSEGRKLPCSPAYWTLTRWSKYGVKSKKTKKLVFLETVQVGGICYTSVEAHRRFVAQLNAD